MRRILSVLMALLLICSIPLSALAIEVNVSYGDVIIGDTQVTHTDSANTTKTEDHDGSVTVKGATDENTITVNVNTEVTVTLDNVIVDNTNNYSAAGMKVTTGEEGKVTVELEGDNTLLGGYEAAGLQTENNKGSLEITDADNDGSLVATGGFSSAGIGGKREDDGTNITISGGKVTATGGYVPYYDDCYSAAGIGGGEFGSGVNITISGGEVTATGGAWGAGIGGAQGGDGTNITISGGTVNAIGGTRSAGIGGGCSADGTNITISGGTVTATGGDWGGAGIGGGTGGGGIDITISGGTVTATGGVNRYDANIGGAGIGSGDYSEGMSSNIVIKDYAQVDATGGNLAADVGDGSGYSTTEKIPDNLTLDLDSDHYAPHSDDHGGGCGRYNDIYGCDGVQLPAEPVAPNVPAAEQDSYIIYTVDTPRWEEKWDYEAGILTITALDSDTNTVKEDAVFTTWGYGIDVLMNHYKIKTVRFVTANAERELNLAELAKLVAVADDEFDLVHTGSESILKLNNEEVKK